MSTPLRTAVMRIMSEMLDDPDADGIYPTGRFMDRIEALLHSMMGAPEVMQLSGSEAVYGFVAWLTTSDDFENILKNPPFDHDHSLSGGQILEAPLPAPCSPPCSLQSALASRNLMKCGVWVWA